MGLSCGLLSTTACSRSPLNYQMGVWNLNVFRIGCPTKMLLNPSEEPKKNLAGLPAQVDRVVLLNWGKLQWSSWGEAQSPRSPKESSTWISKTVFLFWDFLNNNNNNNKILFQLYLDNSKEIRTILSEEHQTFPVTTALSGDEIDSLQAEASGNRLNQQWL